MSDTCVRRVIEENPFCLGELTRLSDAQIESDGEYLKEWSKKAESYHEKEKGRLYDLIERLIAKAENQKILAAKIVEDWLSGQPGNAEFEERFYYAVGVKAPEWLNTWDEEYVQKHQRVFKRWLEEKKEELGLDE